MQGGDYGSLIGPMMGSLAPDRVIGVHVNARSRSASSAGKGVTAEDLASMTDLERDRMARSQDWAARRPATSGSRAPDRRPWAYGLEDSPAGQLAWIVEKFKEWTHSARELPDDAVPRDRLLANVAVYWFTRTGDIVGQPLLRDWGTPGLCRIRRRCRWASPCSRRIWPSADIGERLFNVTHWSDFDTGGHFAAMETPQLLVEDIRTFFATVT